ncbi:hypothetical protein GGP55_002584 [Salinibacter ruber]|uniref:hypothetical protein n=1 Tax=Salinibacter ruber TaxID=146919 RepID=UPI002072CF60|nr:hypothetical protein [Salinibacter ruber]MCS3631973.1 hypothetical protein [Salinibacter ruber]
MFYALVSALTQQYLKVRQQYRHAQALWSHRRTGPDALPDPRFILFGRGRSGTTALLSMLDDVPALHCEGEVLHNYVRYPYRHVLGRSVRPAAPGYGCKILSYQVQDVQTALDEPEAFIHRLWEEGGFQILYLRRTNLLRHALSNIRARREQFHQKKDDIPAEAQALRVDPDRVMDWIRSSEALGAYEKRLLEDVPHRSLTYEKHIRNPEAHQQTIDDICAYLGVESVPIESSYRKIAPPSVREGVANYDELVRRLRETPYEKYLEEQD